MTADIKQGVELGKQYVIVTAVSQFRLRYAIPLDALQSLNPGVQVDPLWALDSVTCCEVEEFSQEHMGETILDHRVVDEDEILEIFDKENSYLSTWDTAQKLRHIRNWQSKLSEE